MKKAIIFDFNGTMFFDEDKHILSWRAYAWNEFHKEIKDEDFPLHIHGFSNKEILAFLAGKEFTKEEVKEHAKRKELYYQKICEEDIEHLHLVNGLEKFLSLLKRKNIPIAICTASMKPNVDWYRKTFHLDQYFEEEKYIYDNGEIKKGKPDPEIYLKAIAKLDVKPEECIVFEDAISGITSAYRAGVKDIYAIKEDGVGKDVSSLPGVKKVMKDFRIIPEEILQEFSL